MSVQAKRRTSSQKRRRAIQLSIKKINFSACAECGKPAQQHRLCRHCGSYKKQAKSPSKQAAKKTKPKQ